jgi:hypothetical protein
MYIKLHIYIYIYIEREREREREREVIDPTIWYVMEAAVIVQKGPAYESAMKAPSNGIKLAVPLKVVTVLAALVIGI